MAKTAKPKLTDEQQVAEYMSTLRHPLIAEIEALRTIIKTADKSIQERVKWNAPSYHYNGEDFVTFNLRTDKHVHLVWHHPSIESISSPILDGEHKGRRMSYFNDMQEVEKNRKEIVKVIKEILKSIG